MTELAYRITWLNHKTQDAYSSNRYNSWPAVISMLVRRGYNDREIEAILRSKWMRWAADSSPKPYGKATFKDVEHFLDDWRNKFNPSEVRQLVSETFAT